MPEPTPCPICGGSHPPDACPGAKEETKTERILTPEEQEEHGRLQEKLQNYLSDGRNDHAQEVINLAKQKGITLDITSACQKELETRLSKGVGIGDLEIIFFAKENNIALNFSKPEFASACQKELEVCLSEGSVDGAQKVISFAKEKKIKLDFATSEIASACQKGLEVCLSMFSGAWIDRIPEIIFLAKEKNIVLEIASACQKGLEVCLSNNRFSDAEQVISFAEENNIKLDFSKPEIASACQKGLEKSLLNNNVESATEINRLFLHLSPEKAFALYSHHLQELLSALEKKAPQLVSQCQKSLELFFSLFAFREKPEALVTTLEANPFLSQALENNPRFGSKLVIKYPEFDNVSKAKIQFLFESKKAILKNNPDIDHGSLEFRQAMQVNLLDIDRNQEIVGKLAKAGVDTEKWLNYEETEYFKLRAGEETVPLSERILTPINRLSETLDSYARQVKEVLLEYRAELVNIQITPKSAEELQEQIKKMEEELAKAKADGDERKIHGVGRGIENLQAKLARIEKCPLWNRIMDEMAMFSKLKDGLTVGQEELLATEKKYQNLLASKSPSGVELSKLKTQMGQAKEDFRIRLAQLERRVEEFRGNLEKLLSPLGTDRATALVQEVNERMVEQFAHYDSDRQTLEYLFSETANKEKEKLEGRAMSVFVWARNPDIDLYQGNYSSCCISIEQTGRGNAPDSAIADYSTDLGIQIVNIWDEKMGEPITAAWCWIGIDENNKTALVVDNIEANKTYNSNFPIELWSELRGYLEKYARAIGVNRLVLGKAHNDLITDPELAKLPEAEAKYTKLGGENSRPNGYFMEAKNQSVKLLWEKGEEKKKEKTKREQKIIELTDIETNGLTKNDYAAILDLEEKIYEGTGLIRGNVMIKDLEAGNGLDYSMVLYGKRPQKIKPEVLGYLVAYEDKTDDGDPCVYLDDIALAPDCQGQDLGWKLLEGALLKMKEKAKQDNKPVLFDMHLRQGSQRLFDKHREDMEKMDVKLVDSALVPDYYDDGEDALYQVYEVKE